MKGRDKSSLHFVWIYAHIRSIKSKTKTFPLRPTLSSQITDEIIIIIINTILNCL